MTTSGRDEPQHLLHYTAGMPLSLTASLRSWLAAMYAQVLGDEGIHMFG